MIKLNYYPDDITDVFDSSATYKNVIGVIFLPLMNERKKKRRKNYTNGIFL